MAFMEGPDNELIRQIGRVLDAGPSLKLAILFGSAARGRLRPDSDLDIAILPLDPELPLASELDLQVALTRATGRSVDLVRLDQAPTLLRWEVARYGRVLAAHPPAERVRFLSETASEHADFAPALERVAHLYRRHLTLPTPAVAPPEAPPAR
jgi:predicted nucleotidyltransferase